MMEDTLLDETIKKMDLIFRIAGINIKSGRNIYPNIKTRLLFYLNIIWLDRDLAGAYYWFINGIITGKDFLSLTYAAPCITLSTLSNIKGFFLIANEQNVLKLIEILKNLEKKDKERKHSDEKDKIVKKERDFLHIVVNGNNWLYLILLVLFAISPVIIIIVKYLNSGEVDLIFPFLVLYPFNATRWEVWPFVYLHQVWSEIVACLYIGSADVLFYTCCTYIRIQFKLLQYNIENLIPVQRDGARFLEDDDFRAKFRDTITWHQELIECAQILEKIYSKTNLFNFMSSSLIICLTGFNVTRVNDMAFFVTFLSFLSMSLFQIFFLCFFADLLMNSSVDINDAVYQSLWYTAEPKIEKNMLIMQTRAQKPCQLSALGFADVNLHSFMTILSTSWSYFALLQTLYRD